MTKKEKALQDYVEMSIKAGVSPDLARSYANDFRRQRATIAEIVKKTANVKKGMEEQEARERRYAFLSSPKGVAFLMELEEKRRKIMDEYYEFEDRKIKEITTAFNEIIEDTGYTVSSVHEHTVYLRQKDSRHFEIAIDFRPDHYADSYEDSRQYDPGINVCAAGTISVGQAGGAAREYYITVGKLFERGALIEKFFVDHMAELVKRHRENYKQINEIDILKRNPLQDPVMNRLDYLC